MTVDQIAERLHARHGIARCPAHKDRSPSLSIREGDDGRILLHCFSGCTIESICAGLGIEVADLFPRPGTFEPKPRIVREADKLIADLRTRLTPRERVLTVTIIYLEPENLEAGLARALALSVQGEIVQCVMERE